MGRIEYGRELVVVKRVGTNPHVIVCEVRYGEEKGREVGVRVRESGRWHGWEGREVEVERGGVEPWVYRGVEPGVHPRARWRLKFKVGHGVQRDG